MASREYIRYIVLVSNSWKPHFLSQKPLWAARCRQLIAIAASSRCRQDRSRVSTPHEGPLVFKSMSIHPSFRDQASSYIYKLTLPAPASLVAALTSPVLVSELPEGVERAARRAARSLSRSTSRAANDGDLPCRARRSATGSHSHFHTWETSISDRRSFQRSRRHSSLPMSPRDGCNPRRNTDYSFRPHGDGPTGTRRLPRV